MRCDWLSELQFTLGKIKGRRQVAPDLIVFGLFDLPANERRRSLTSHLSQKS